MKSQKESNVSTNTKFNHPLHIHGENGEMIFSINKNGNIQLRGKTIGKDKEVADIIQSYAICFQKIEKEFDKFTEIISELRSFAEVH